MSSRAVWKKQRLIRRGRRHARMLPPTMIGGLGPAQRSQVNRMIKQTMESKYKDSLSTSSNLNATGIFEDTTDISQGDTATTRDGDEILLQSLEVNFYAFTDPISNDRVNACRVIVFFWNSNNTPIVTDLLEDATGSLPHLSPMNNGNKKRILILYDRRFLVQSQTGPQGVIPQRFVISIPRKLQKVTYVTGSNNAVRRLYIFFCSDSSATPSPDIQYYVRLRYKDP